MRTCARRLDRQTDGQIDGQIDGQPHRQTDGQLGRDWGRGRVRIDRGRHRRVHDQQQQARVTSAQGP